ELAPLGAALEIADRVRAERKQRLLHGVGAELGRLPAGERRLAECRDALLVAQVRGLARLLRLALGEVARVDDEDAALGGLEDGAAHLDREGAAVLPAVGRLAGQGALLHQLLMRGANLLDRFPREDRVGAPGSALRHGPRGENDRGDSRLA